MTISVTRLRKLRELERQRAKTCPTCAGSGEVTHCVNDGSHGCSHPFDPTYPCPPDCQGSSTA